MDYDYYPLLPGDVEVWALGSR